MKTFFFPRRGRAFAFLECFIFLCDRVSFLSFAGLLPLPSDTRGLRAIVDCVDVFVLVS